MTNGTSGYLPPDKKRSVIENSILAFRPEDARKYQWDPPDARQALADLAAATNIPRLVNPDLSSGLMAGAERQRAPFVAVILASGYDSGPAVAPGGRGFHRPGVVLPGSQGWFTLVRERAGARRCAATRP